MKRVLLFLLLFAQPVFAGDCLQRLIATVKDSPKLVDAFEIKTGTVQQKKILTFIYRLKSKPLPSLYDLVLTTVDKSLARPNCTDRPENLYIIDPARDSYALKISEFDKIAEFRSDSGMWFAQAHMRTSRVANAQ